MRRKCFSWLTTSETLFPAEIPFTQAGCFWEDSWASAVCLTTHCTSHAATTTPWLRSPCLCYCYRLQYILSSHLRSITLSRGRPHSSRRHATHACWEKWPAWVSFLHQGYSRLSLTYHPSQGVCIHHTARVCKDGRVISPSSTKIVTTTNC